MAATLRADALLASWLAEVRCGAASRTIVYAAGAPRLRLGLGSGSKQAVSDLGFFGLFQKQKDRVTHLDPVASC